MTEARYHELLGRMLDGRISEADAGELRRGLETDHARLRDLREHLTLWELCAQEQSPDRGADAFRQRFEARLMAEIDRPEGVVADPLPGRHPGRRRFSRRVVPGLRCGGDPRVDGGTALGQAPGRTRSRGSPSSARAARLPQGRGRLHSLHPPPDQGLPARPPRPRRWPGGAMGSQRPEAPRQPRARLLPRRDPGAGARVVASEHGRWLLLATRLEVQH